MTDEEIERMESEEKDKHCVLFFSDYEKLKAHTEALEKENAELKTSREQFRKDNEECHKKIMNLYTQIEKMKHCWNCRNRVSGNHHCVDCQSVEGKKIIRKNWGLAI